MKECSPAGAVAQVSDNTEKDLDQQLCSPELDWGGGWGLRVTTL